MKCHKPSIFKGLWHSYADSCVKDENILSDSAIHVKPNP